MNSLTHSQNPDGPRISFVCIFVCVCVCVCVCVYIYFCVCVCVGAVSGDVPAMIHSHKQKIPTALGVSQWTLHNPRHSRILLPN